MLDVVGPGKPDVNKQITMSDQSFETMAYEVIFRVIFNQAYEELFVV